MNLKIRSALLFGLIVTVLLSIAFWIIYLQNSWFRKEEFELRLKQRAEVIYNLFTGGMQMDSVLMQVIDSSTLNKLHEEKVLIIDQDNTIMYSSSDSNVIHITPALLGKIRDNGHFFFSDGEAEAVGILMKNPRREGIIIASGYDKYGKRKIRNLFFVLSVCWIGGILITGLLSYIYVRRVFRPLDELNMHIQEVAEGNLKQRIPVNQANNELTKMAQNFNAMLDQLEQSFEVQKSFLQHASHELRTPLSNLLLQTEAALSKESNKEYREALLDMYEDQKFLVDMVNSILSLSNYQQLKLAGSLQLFRVDELLFETVEELKTYHPGFNIQVDFSDIPLQEKELMIQGVPSMMKIVFSNLIRNACYYSTNDSVRITIEAGNARILINFYNDGPVIIPEERNKLFMPFFRGSNVSKKRGHGLGLSISKRVVDVHNGRLFYTTSEDGLNCFGVLLFNF